MTEGVGQGARGLGIFRFRFFASLRMTGGVIRMTECFAQNGRGFAQNDRGFAQNDRELCSGTAGGALSNGRGLCSEWQGADH